MGPRIGDLTVCGAAALWAYGAGLGVQHQLFFSKLWRGEAFHKLGVQSADVSALSGALPQPSVFPASQQSSWIRELTRSAAMSQLPSCISPRFVFF
jgi:hypothetical protein